MAGVAAVAGEHRAQAVEHPVVSAYRLADDQRAATLQCLTDTLATGYLTDTGVAGIVGEQHQVASEVGGVCAAEVEQHAVVAGHRDDLHALDAGRCTERLTHCAWPPLQARRATGVGAVRASAEAARRMALSAASGCAGDGQLRNMSGGLAIVIVVIGRRTTMEDFLQFATSPVKRNHRCISWVVCRCLCRSSCRCHGD